MLSAARKHAGRAREERGMTLVEVLVAMVTGVVVLGSAYSILEVSLHQSARLADYAQSAQIGRTAMTRIVDELHSACIAEGFKPVQAGSGESKLVLIDAYSEEAKIGTSETGSGGNTIWNARKDTVVWSEAGKTLTDSTYKSTGGSWPEYTFANASTPAAGTRLADRVTKAEIENPETKAKETPPVFRYFDYATKPATQATEPLSTLAEVTPPAAGFSKEEAEKVAAVQVSFRTAPPSGSKEADRRTDLTSQVTLAFSAARSEATIQDAPCQ
jgi:prepilin-type N-terminal cleavage/methylation domain-containing protein